MAGSLVLWQLYIARRARRLFETRHLIEVLRYNSCGSQSAVRTPPSGLNVWRKLVERRLPGFHDRPTHPPAYCTVWQWATMHEIGLYSSEACGCSNFYPLSVQDSNNRSAIWFHPLIIKPWPCRSLGHGSWSWAYLPWGGLLFEATQASESYL